MGLLLKTDSTLASYADGMACHSLLPNVVEDCMTNPKIVCVVRSRLALHGIVIKTWSDLFILKPVYLQEI